MREGPQWLANWLALSDEEREAALEEWSPSMTDMTDQQPEDPTVKEYLQIDRLREHISSHDCWCEPELDYKDPDTGAEVWVHRELQ